jgi:hypothetical protein
MLSRNLARDGLAVFDPLVVDCADDQGRRRYDGARRRCAGAASHSGSQHIDLATWREGVETVLDQPADSQQAS